MSITEATVTNTNDFVRAVIAEALDEGLTQQELRDRIQEAFGDRRAKWQLDRIARTEVHHAQEGASYVAAHQNGVEMKRWITARDSRVRGLEKKPHADHDAIEKHGPIPLSTPFKDPVSGSELMFPGDTGLGAGPQDIINCRCSWIAAFDDDEKFVVDPDAAWKQRDREFDLAVTDLARIIRRALIEMERRALARFDAHVSGGVA